MLEFTDYIQRNIDLKNPDRTIVVKLYYSDTEFYAFTNRGMTVDSIMSWPSVIKYTPSKSKWNWQGKNNVTLSVPSLSLTNVETPDGTSLWNDVRNLGFYGQRAEVYLSFDENEVDSSDLFQLFNGVISDITFSAKANSISVKLKNNAVPNTEIQGEAIDYGLGTVGDVSMTANVRESGIVYSPVLFGYHYCHQSPVADLDTYIISSTAYSDVYTTPYSTGGFTK